ncbi:protein phosphatase [Azospirillum agricola]|uniref:PP2C family protein-serine/threonine phosphatase n=1 Tax=Azospirillum agricola TaxID=1720247 RepID=UPI001AE58700|nr:protein phosphatase 2C domain-containing protein [Azospirillum agricola]MBP2230524.1 protein phosphatase [Azospirillum agricola]
MPVATFALTATGRIAGRTDVGRARARNEDSLHVDPAGRFAIVCDGMGGHAGGDIASRKAVEVIAGLLEDAASAPPCDFGGVEGDGPDGGDTVRTLPEPDREEAAIRGALALARSAVRRANARIHALNRQRGFADGRGMGTTVVGWWLVPDSNRIVAFHAGDSRLYRLRGGEFRALTRDHSLYQLWLDNGGNGTAPHRNIILRALGTGEEVEPEAAAHALLPDDVLLLCSDGLNGMLPDTLIARILRQEPDPERACAALVDAANTAGGQDNITVAVARFSAT